MGAERTYLGRFIAASGMTNLADGVATVVWAWMASLLTRDPILIALLPVALRLPWFVFAVPAGLITDRFDRRMLLLWMDVIRCAAFCVVTCAVWVSLPLAAPAQTGSSDPTLFWVLVGAALVIGMAEVIRDNAAQTMMPSVVPHDQLERANGRLWSVELVGNALLGPAIGAFLIAVAVPLPFALNAAAFGCAAVLILGMTGSYAPAIAQGAQSPPDWRRELKEGFAFLMGAPVLKLLAVSTGAWNLLHQMIVIALVLHVQENLGLGAVAYGLILAAGAIGGIFGGFFGDHVVRWLGRGPAAQWANLISCLSFAAIPFAPGPIALGLVFVVSEGVGIVWNTVSVSYRQRVIPNALLGRVNSIYRLLAWGMMPVGLVLSGVIVRVSEGPLPRETALTMPFVVAGVGGILLTLLIWRPLGRAFKDPA